jgi:hypothetical protein
MFNEMQRETQSFLNIQGTLMDVLKNMLDHKEM